MYTCILQAVQHMPSCIINQQSGLAFRLQEFRLMKQRFWN